MATTIQIKRSQTGTSAPTLAYGELSYSFEDATRKLWIGDNAANTVEVVGGRYYTDLFPASLNGTNEDGKIVITKSDGSINHNNNALSGVSTLTATDATIGGATHKATIDASSSTVQFHGAANTNLSLAAGSSANLILLGALDVSAGTSTVKDHDSMTTDGVANSDTGSATHLATQQSIKAYVDNEVSGSSSISSANSSATISDTALTVDIGSNSTALVVGDASTTINASNAALVLKSKDATTNDGDSASSIVFEETAGGDLASIVASHDGGQADKRGKLELKTNALGGTSTTTAISIDSNQKVRIFGDLEVDGTTTQIDSTNVTVDDPVLMLGGDFGEITAFNTSHSGNAWTVDKTHIIDATGGSGVGSKWKVVVGGSVGSETYTVTKEEGGAGYKTTDTLSLADPDNTGGNAAPVEISPATVTTGPASDDSLERGVSFHYHNGSAAKIGFFGMTRSSNIGKFSFIPEATYSNNTYSGTAGTLVNNVEGSLTGDVKATNGDVIVDSGADKGASKIDVGATGQITGKITATSANQSNITTVGTLIAGGIDATSAFGIDTGTGNITTSGKLSINVDGATGTAGTLSFGQTGGAADAEIYYKDTTGTSGTKEFVITTGENLLMTADSLKITPDANATAGQELSFLHDLNAANPSFKMGTGANEQLEVSSVFTLKELQSVKINTKTEGATDDDGKIEFAVDDKDIFHIGDNGIYGKQNTTGGGGYSWQNDEDAALEQFDYPQLDGFYINGGVWAESS